MSTDTFSLPCLGRSIYLGMLYDCRSDSVVPGVTLWNRKTLNEFKDTRKRGTSKFEVTMDESLEKKANLMDINASMKLSFCAGLITVEGSAKYLDDKKSSNYQARVTLSYQCQTFFEQLTMDQLGIQNIEYKDVFDKGTATHVVTGVEYGASAHFVFDRKISDSEDKRKVEGALKAIIDKIPTIKIEGEASVKISEEDVKEGNKFSCTYHGDVMLEENPCTFEDAIRVYQNLPKLIKEQTANGDVYGVPVKVYLYPLEKLDSNAARLVRHISDNLISDCAATLEGWGQVLVDTGDILDNPDLTRFLAQVDHIKQARRIISAAVTDFQGSMCMLLPGIRGGGKEEVVLASKLAEMKSSIVNPVLLYTWVEAKREEAAVITEYLKSLTEFECAFKPGEITKFVQNPDVSYVLAFSFGRITASDSDVFVGLLQDASSGESITSGDGEGALDSAWFRNNETLASMQRRIKAYKGFYAANKADPTGAKIVFVLTTERGRTANQIEPGTTFLFQEGIRKEFQLPVLLAAPRVQQADDAVGVSSVALEWDAPDQGSKSIEAYYVRYFHSSDDNREVYKSAQQFSECRGRVGDLHPNTGYQFAVVPTTRIGEGAPSPFSSSISTSTPSYAAELIKSDACDLIAPPDANNPAWYQLKKNLAFNIAEDRLRKYEINARSPLGVAEKILIVLGATGAGKTTLINGLINYIFGVRHSDPYRLVLIKEDTQKSQAHSQTKEITAYTINHHPLLRIPFSLTIVDTPGYGDTQGIYADAKITEQVRKFFKMTGQHAVDQVHAVGFVAQASLARLTPTQKYIFDSIQALFGKDVSDSIFPLLTFADGREPQILKSLQEHKIPFKRYFKFNSSVFTQTPREMNVDNAGGDVDQFDALFWDMASSSFNHFLTQLANKKAVSLSLTREVLDERSKLEIKIEGFQHHIQQGLNKLSLMRQELPMIEQLDAEVNANKDYYRIVEVPKTRRVPFDEPGRYVTNCLNCSFTCHEHCGIPNDEDKAGCWAMTNGSCRICKQKCHWSKHVNRPHYFEEYVENEKITVDDLKNKYDMAINGISTKESMLIGISEEYTAVQRNLLADVAEVQKCLARLDQIALKPDPLSTVEYIDLLIDSTKIEKKAGWKYRLEQLENARRRAVMMQQMRSQGQNYDPFAAFEKEIREEAQEKSVLTRVKKWFGWK